MRVEPYALAALQTRLLNLMRGGEEARAPGFNVEAPPLPSPASTANPSGSAVPASSLAMLVAASAAPLSRRAVLRRAERGLVGLERLHRLIRGGGSRAHALDELAGWRDEGGAGEGVEGALLEEVELRILIELAKEGR